MLKLGHLIYIVLHGAYLCLINRAMFVLIKISTKHLSILVWYGSSSTATTATTSQKVLIILLENADEV